MHINYGRRSTWQYLTVTGCQYLDRFLTQYREGLCNEYDRTNFTYLLFLQSIISGIVTNDANIRYCFFNSFICFIVKMSMHTLPILLINLNGEMLYILEQRLRAQTIPPVKIRKGSCLDIGVNTGEGGTRPPRNHSGGRQCYSSPRFWPLKTCCVMNMIAQQAVHKPPLCFRPHTEIFHQFPAVGCHASALRRSLLVPTRRHRVSSCCRRR